MSVSQMFLMWNLQLSPELAQISEKLGIKEKFPQMHCPLEVSPAD